MIRFTSPLLLALSLIQPSLLRAKNETHFFGCDELHDLIWNNPLIAKMSHLFPTLSAKTFALAEEKHEELLPPVSAASNDAIAPQPKPVKNAPLKRYYQLYSKPQKAVSYNKPIYPFISNLFKKMFNTSAIKTSVQTTSNVQHADLTLPKDLQEKFESIDAQIEDIKNKHNVSTYVNHRTTGSSEYLPLAFQSKEINDLLNQKRKLYEAFLKNL